MRGLTTTDSADHLVDDMPHDAASPSFRAERQGRSKARIALPLILGQSRNRAKRRFSVELPFPTTLRLASLSSDRLMRYFGDHRVLCWLETRRNRRSPASARRLAALFDVA
nr:hypothetical protein CFP56_16479 [Quercus suber]